MKLDISQSLRNDVFLSLSVDSATDQIGEGDAVAIFLALRNQLESAEPVAPTEPVLVSRTPVAPLASVPFPEHPAPTAVTQAAAIESFRQYVSTAGLEQAGKLLASFEVKRVTELPDEKLAEFVAALA